jgi:hypothetical protein
VLVVLEGLERCVFLVAVPCWEVVGVLSGGRRVSIPFSGC